MKRRLLVILGTVLALLLCACAGPNGQGIEIQPKGQMIMGGSIGHS